MLRMDMLAPSAKTFSLQDAHTRFTLAPRVRVVPPFEIDAEATRGGDTNC